MALSALQQLGQHIPNPVPTAPNLGSCGGPGVWALLSASRFEEVNDLLPLEVTCPSVSSPLRKAKCDAEDLDMLYGSLNHPGGL